MQLFQLDAMFYVQQCQSQNTFPTDKISHDPEKAGFFFFLSFCHRSVSLGLTGSLNTDLYDTTIMEDIHLQYVALY